MRELTLDSVKRVGSRGKAVKRIQEWLTLNGLAVVVDGDFGPATEFAVKAFQKDQGTGATGRVTQEIFDQLTEPMHKALVAGRRREVGQRLVELAARHLRSMPREVGGANRGPWVRLYMRGHEGDQWLWCAGFVCFLLERACTELQQQMPIKASFSCDSLAANAKDKGRFLRGSQADPSKLPPGTFFLSRKSSQDWDHIGIVLEAGARHMLTLEGNTNDTGGREGYQVCRRIRGYKRKDFILIHELV